jgi:hypothetical protein
MATLRGHEVPAAAQERLQAVLDQKNADAPPDHIVPTVIAIFRHECTAARGAKEDHGISSALDLHERYVIDTDPAYGMLYREGKCKCGVTARSREGRFVETSKRPPITGRVARG